jgi:hypothetical protein
MNVLDILPDLATLTSFEPTFIFPKAKDLRLRVRSETRDTYANIAFFRFRLSFFTWERCCLRLAAASGLAVNYRNPRSNTMSGSTPYLLPW